METALWSSLYPLFLNLSRLILHAKLLHCQPCSPPPRSHCDSTLEEALVMRANHNNNQEDFDEDMEEDDTGAGRRSFPGRRGPGGGVSPPRCQVENCGSDLSEAKRYHRRHKVCEVHAKAAAVMVAGLRQRFCQQCSRFHELTEFDESKRSCRRRLAGHNERRRKSSAETSGEGTSRRFMSFNT